MVMSLFPDYDIAATAWNTVQDALQRRAILKNESGTATFSSYSEAREARIMNKLLALN